ELAKLSRTPCQLAIITLDLCSLVYGVGACTAAGAAGTECYNTYPTCQDRSNFARTTKEYKFSSHEAPLPFKAGERPYIKSISYLPTEIKDSLTVKGRVTLEMTDEPDTDIGIDPYVANRATVQGNFWKKLLSRNPNYKGRPLKLYDGFVGLTESDFTTDGKMFSGIIDNITLGKGTVKIEAVDLLKALDQVEIPAKLNIKLASDISAAQTSITFISDDMASLDTPTGYVRIDDETIYYGAISTTTKIISSCTRGMFGTTAATHSANTKVQAVKYYAEDNPFDTMEQILTDAGIAAGDIDSTAFVTEEAFVADLSVYSVISEPTKASDLYYELVDLLGCKTWVSESLKITIARNLPNHPDRTYTALTDNDDILDGSCSVDLNQQSLITRCSLYWDKNVTGAEDEASSYGRLDVAVDADAEGVNEYNQESEKKIMSRWLHSDVTGTEEEINAWVTAVVSRQVWQHRDPMPLLSLDVEIKDSGLLTGQHAQISTDELQDADGNDLSGVTFQIVRRERKENKLTLKCLRVTDKRICYITPNDAPDFDVATAAEKLKYGYVCEATGKMADFTEGYVIY
ncbi:MAG: hypothetical protein WC547_06600, partial [Candidatus Omnitrophota bacterium]